MNQQLHINGLEPTAHQFPSAVPMKPIDLITPAEAAEHGIGSMALTSEENADTERIDDQAQGNFTMTSVRAGVETVVHARHTRRARRHAKTPREQGKARWYVTGEKRHPEVYPDTEE
jgi:hypothetical protein